jgi:transposase
MSKSQSSQRGQARIKLPVRDQIEMQFLSLDQWLDPEHRVRLVNQYVDSLDLTQLYSQIKATVAHVGRDAIDPRIMFAVWLFATIEGITSARRIAELCERDIAYMWLCGGVSINHHRLSDFRTDHGDLLERILIDSIAVLLHNDLITLDTIAQDGMRVRASAGSSSFRTTKGLETARHQAAEHLQKLRAQAEQPVENQSVCQPSAKARAAAQKLARIEQAQQEMQEIQAKYDARVSSQPRSTPRASTTDPEARRMKMGDLGYRPALNVQFASDGKRQLIVAVEVTNQGSDSGLMLPMYEQVCEQYPVTPQHYLVDGGFNKQADITALEQAETAVYVPVHDAERQLKKGQDPYAPRASESVEMGRYRQRMSTEEAKNKYKERGMIAEFPNADCRNRGLTQFRVRGLVKAQAQTLWHALAYNFMRLKSLFCEQRQQSYLEVLMRS